MSLGENLSLADVRDHLSEVVAQVEAQHARVVITKHGRPAAVLMSVEDLASLEETLEIMSDPRAMAALVEAESDIHAGRTETMSKKEALARWGGSG
ncbi:MAG TPA: type II toxin-antitoxin system Phd/YefM family antitoxin [Acidimicrobiales bacterium]|nr:type II toxin-antitoxin system Phd/YefM family antitoxin [Acidimicrobiales bacterium]